MSEPTAAQLEASLRSVKYLRPFEVAQHVERKTWALDGYINGYLSHEILDIEMQLFRHHATRLLAKEDLYRTLARLNEPPTEAERLRRLTWQKQQAQRTAALEARLEVKRQRALLKEGHRTLSSIRRVLRGQDPLPSLASEPAKTSPT